MHVRRTISILNEATDANLDEAVLAHMTRFGTMPTVFVDNRRNT
jgi:hypothetical protein